MPYFYIITAPDRELQLAQAELSVMAGGSIEGRAGWSNVAVDISHAAYVNLCVRQIACAGSLEELCAAIACQGLRADGFAVRVVRQASNVSETTPRLCKQVADAIVGSPNLDAPRVEFCLLIRGTGLWFGRIVSRSLRTWQSAPRLPHQYSCALEPRFARALVNLVAAAGDKLLDMCCGIGTVVRQALIAGVDAYGWEVNERIAQKAAANLAAMGYNNRIIVTDARKSAGRFDAVVADLPYGLTSCVETGFYGQMLEAAGRLAPRAVVVAGRDIQQLAEKLGYRVIVSAQVPKTRLTRHVYLLAAG